MTTLSADDVTVVIPVHGPQPWLDEAIASARLDRPAEVILVENGSERVDGGALPDGVRLLRFGAIGRSRARNEGVAAARTPYVAFLDADDRTLPGRLPRQRDALVANPGAALCCSCVEAIDSDGAVIAGESAREHERFSALLARGFSVESLLVDCAIYTSGTLVRRDHFLAAGGFDREIDAYEDLDLYLRLADRWQIVAVNSTPLAQHRRHGSNTASHALYEGALHVSRKHLASGVERTPGRRRALLLERRVDSLWGLGDLSEARRAALRAARDEPALLRHARFRKRLVASLLPTSFVTSLRRIR